MECRGPAAAVPSLPEWLALCASVLPGDDLPVGADNLFDLGGDSLTVTALVAEALARWGAELDPGAVFLAEDLGAVHGMVLETLSAVRDAR
jgi:hypothetical protein